MTALSQRRERWLLLTLAAVQFATVFDFMIPMPLGAQLMQLFDLTPTQFGLLVSVYMVTASAVGFAASFVVDRFDRRAILLALCAGFAATTVLTATAQSYAWLLAARATAGAFGGVLAATVLAIVGDTVPDGRRGRALGVVMSGPSFASILGIPISIWLAASSSWRAPFFFNTALCAAILAAAFVYVPRVHAHVAAARGRSALAQISAVFGRRNHLRAFALTIALNFSGFLIVPFIAPYFISNVGISQTELPVTYFCGGLAALVFVRLHRPADRSPRTAPHVRARRERIGVRDPARHAPAAGRAVGRRDRPGPHHVDISRALRAGGGDPSGRGGAGAPWQLHEPERGAAAALGRNRLAGRGRDGRSRAGRRADRTSGRSAGCRSSRPARAIAVATTVRPAAPPRYNPEMPMSSHPRAFALAALVVQAASARRRDARSRSARPATTRSPLRTTAARALRSFTCRTGSRTGPGRSRSSSISTAAAATPRAPRLRPHGRARRPRGLHRRVPERHRPSRGEAAHLERRPVLRVREDGEGRRRRLRARAARGARDARTDRHGAGLRDRPLQRRDAELPPRRAALRPHRGAAPVAGSMVLPEPRADDRAGARRSRAARGADPPHPQHRRQTRALLRRPG